MTACTGSFSSRFPREQVSKDHFSKFSVVSLAAFDLRMFGAWDFAKPTSDSFNVKQYYSQSNLQPL